MTDAFRQGPVSYMFNGCEISLLDFDPSDIDPSDLVRSACLTSRFCGQTSHFYSSAQHAVIGSYIAEDMFGLEIAQTFMAGVTPDYFIGEMNASLACMFDGICEVRNEIGRSILKHLGGNPDMWECAEVRETRRRLMAIEFRDLKSNCKPPCNMTDPDPSVVIAPASPGRIYMSTVNRVRELFPVLSDHQYDLEHLSETEISKALFN